MIQEIQPKLYNNHYFNKRPEENAYLICFSGEQKKDDQILLKDEETVSIPKIKEIQANNLKTVYLFSIDKEEYFLAFEEIKANELVYKPIKELRKNNSYQCFAAMTAYHLFQWYRDNKCCGRCGSANRLFDKERALICPKCGKLTYPTIAPAVIIGLINDDSILISTYAGRNYKGRALLAGFCEIGETPEETVAREVMEEVGLKVKNIRYYKSQPWGFDMNLLLGYFCEVEGSVNIKMDEEELATAQFIKRSDIEKDSNLLSLTATMIEAFREGEV